MAYPVPSTPIYETTLPSTGKKIKFRPMLVKEEKSLLIAQQSEDLSVMIATIYGIIEACTQGKLVGSDLATFDVEWMITQIRARSVGEVVELIFGCNACEGKDTRTTVSIDLTTIKMETNPDHKKVIPLFDDVGVIMKYPSMDSIGDMNAEDVEVDTAFDVLCDCIESVYTADSVYATKEQPREELLEFIDNLTKEQMERIQNFFNTQPKLTHTVNYVCPACGTSHTKKIEGFKSFFH